MNMPRQQRFEIDAAQAEVRGRSQARLVERRRPTDA
jgi:hypothetical protein